MKRFVMRRLVTVLYVSGIYTSALLGLPSNAMASGFQLFEQDVTSVSNYHAGYAVLADNASIAFYNPAGITEFNNPQLVVGGIAIMPNFKYTGTVNVNGLNLGGFGPLPTTAQGGTFNLSPELHFVAPITDRIGFGFSVDVPFGLKTNYGNSIAAYAASLTSVTLVDVSPALGFKITDKGSVGVGLDVQRMDAELDNMSTLFTPVNNTTSVNKANDTGYGYHLGGLYNFTPNTRLGLSYHSQVVFHLRGTSQFSGPLADTFNGGPLNTNNANTKITLPPYTALSLYQKLDPQFALMGTAIYTQWNTFNNLTLNNVAGLVPAGPFFLVPSTTIQTVIPEHYRNTWNFALGGDYYVTPGITLRCGVGYDETPVRDAYRDLQLPDNDRYAVSLGGHFQATKTLGMDVGWMHVFFKQATVNPPPQVTGAQVVTVNGHVTGGADLFGGQVVWDII